MNKQYDDIFIGKINEDYITDVICSHFNIKKLNKTGSFHQLDFYSDDKIYFEIKSRRCNHNKYSSTMIGYNKIEWIHKNNIKDVYFVFVFEDGDYFYKYNKEDKFETGLGGRWDRGKNEIKNYYYIPISKLSKF